jgi:hypothetical protein
MLYRLHYAMSEREGTAMCLDKKSNIRTLHSMGCLFVQLSNLSALFLKLGFS